MTLGLKNSEWQHLPFQNFSLVLKKSERSVHREGPSLQMHLCVQLKPPRDMGSGRTWGLTFSAMQGVLIHTTKVQ